MGLIVISSSQSLKIFPAFFTAISLQSLRDIRALGLCSYLQAWCRQRILWSCTMDWISLQVVIPVRTLVPSRYADSGAFARQPPLAELLSLQPPTRRTTHPKPIHPHTFYSLKGANLNLFQLLGLVLLNHVTECGDIPSVPEPFVSLHDSTSHGSTTTPHSMPLALFCHSC